MRERNKIILEYGTYMLSFFVSYIASLAKWYYASGIILIVEAVYLYVHWVRESGSFVELRALFTLAWVGGQGISCLKHITGYMELYNLVELFCDIYSFWNRI